jgi:hypothetical protein
VNSVRQLLANYNPKEALFFGEPLTNGEGGGPRGKRYYMGGGGGYILSKETLNRFVGLLKDPRSDGEVGCDRHAHISGEDPYIGNEVSFYTNDLQNT